MYDIIVMMIWTAQAFIRPNGGFLRLAPTNIHRNIVVTSRGSLQLSTATCPTRS